MSAQLWLADYRSCAQARPATFQALEAELRSIESLARSKGLGPTLERVRERHDRRLAVSSRAIRPCVDGPAAALAGTRRALAAFRTWVERAPIHALTQAEVDAVATREIFAVEDAYGAAAVNRDETALRRILDDTLAFDRGDGIAGGADRLIATLRGLNLIHHRMTERTVVIRAGVGIVTGTAELAVASPTQPVVSRLPYTASYRRRNGAWRMVALHMPL